MEKDNLLYVYFLSYALGSDKTGNCEYILNKPITSYKDIEPIQQELSSNKKAIIINYILMRTKNKD